MIEPIKVIHRQRLRWTHKRIYLVEWTLWRQQRPMTAPAINAALASHFAVSPGPTNVAKRLLALVDAGKVVRLSRGLYVHATYSTIFQ